MKKYDVFGIGNALVDCVILVTEKFLKENNIEHKNDIEVDVFNSPFQFINRRNEITVTVISDI